MISQQHLDQLRISGDSLSEGLKKFVLENVPQDETLTGEQIFERLQAADEQFSVVFSDRMVRQDLTIRHMVSDVTIHLLVDNITRVAGAWFLDTVTNNGVVYQSRWWIERMRENSEATAEVLQKIGEVLGAYVTVPLPERVIQMPIPPWYWHGKLGTTHCISGSYWVFLSEGRLLLDNFVRETHKLFLINQMAKA